jgi:hypothetical protein
MENSYRSAKHDVQSNITAQDSAKTNLLDGHDNFDGI